MDPNAQPSTPTPEATSPAPEAVPPAPHQPTGGAPTADDPGKLLGILSVVAPFVSLGVVGIILGIIGRKKSKAAGFKGTLATVGIVLSSISIVIGILLIILFAAAIGKVAQKCNQLGPGTHTENGVTYTCG